MRNISRLLVNKSKAPSGFTLLELLAAIVIGTTVVGTLLSFLVTILDTDRKEQAKVNTQEEIQAALDFIADDLKEAVYIYDANSLNKDRSSTTPSNSGIKDQLPFQTSTDRVPVLVFWKRNFLDKDSNIDTVSGNRPVRCVQYATNTNCFGSSRYVYSLVGYYIMKDNNSNWSSSTRIGRFEVTDGIRAACAETNPALCTTATINLINYVVRPNPVGFNRFDASQQNVQNISEVMNTWSSGISAYSIDLDVLVDYIDDTPYTSVIDDPSSSSPVKLSIGPNTPRPAPNPNGIVVNNDCDVRAGTGVGSTRIPDTFTTGATVRGMSGFYACVNSTGDRPLATVFLRGNALARLQNLQTSRVVSDASTTFIPTSNVKVIGRGIVNLSR